MSLDISLMKTEHHEIYWANITHNLRRMAQEVNLDVWLWDAIENGVKEARELIEPLREGIKKLKADPEHYKQFNSPNGWGMYDNFVPWLGELLAACEKYPNSSIYVSK